MEYEKNNSSLRLQLCKALQRLFNPDKSWIVGIEDGLRYLLLFSDGQSVDLVCVVHDEVVLPENC